MAEILNYNKQSNSILYNFITNSRSADRSIPVIKNLFELSKEVLSDSVSDIDLFLHIDYADGCSFYLTCAIYPSFSSKRGYTNLRKPLIISDRIFLQEDNIVYLDRHNAIEFYDHSIIISSGKDDLSTSRIKIDKYNLTSEIELYFIINSYLNLCSLVISDLLNISAPEFYINPLILRSLRPELVDAGIDYNLRTPPALIRVLNEDKNEIEVIIPENKLFKNNTTFSAPVKAINNPGNKINKKPAALKRVLQNV